MSLFSFFNSPKSTAETTPIPVEKNSNTSQERVLSVIETIDYLKENEGKLRDAKTVVDFFEIIKPVTTFPFSGGISVPKDTVRNRALEHVKNNAIINESPEQTLAKKDNHISAIISAVKLERAVDGFPTFKNILAETILREMLGKTEVQPTPGETLGTSSEITPDKQHVEDHSKAVHISTVEEEPHHGEMEHLRGPLATYVSMNTAPVREVVGGEIVPIVPASPMVTSEQIPQESESPVELEEPHDIPQDVVTPILNETSLQQDVIPHVQPITPEDIGNEIGLLTKVEVKELQPSTTETEETHLEILHPPTPARAILLGVKPRKNIFQEIEADVEEFVAGETSNLNELIEVEKTAFITAENAILRSRFFKKYLGRMPGFKTHIQEEAQILGTFQRRPHRFGKKGRSPARLIGAHSLPKKSDIPSNVEHSSVTPQPSVTVASVSVLRPKQMARQTYIPSSQEISVEPTQPSVETTTSSQNKAVSEVEHIQEPQTMTPVVEHVIETPAPQKEISQEQAPETPEANPLIYIVEDGETLRDIVYNHLAHIGAFEGLSEQEKNKLLNRGILYVNEKKLVSNVNEVHVGQSINLSTLTKEILSETESTVSNANSVGPFGRFAN